MIRSMDKYTDIGKRAFIETDRYIYANPITRWLTNSGQSACARLRKFDTQGSLVVDLGCGTGTHFRYISSSDFVGLDSMSEMLAEARQNVAKRGFLVQGDIFNLPFRDGSIASIISFGVLEHLAPLVKALREIHRVMREDGEFIFGIPCEGFLYRIFREFTTKRHVEKATGVDYDELLAKEHVNRCTDILTALEKLFIIDKLRGVPFVVPSINMNFVLIGRCHKAK